jgi:hypothetical protein
VAEREALKFDICSLAGWFPLATMDITLGLDGKRVYPDLDKIADKFLVKLKEYRELME